MNAKEQDFDYHKKAFLSMGMSDERAEFCASVSVGKISGDIIKNPDSKPQDDKPTPTKDTPASG